MKRIRVGVLAVVAALPIGRQVLAQNYGVQERYWQVEENAARRLAEASHYIEQQQRALANEARSHGDNAIAIARQADALAQQAHEQRDSVVSYNQARQNVWAAQNRQLPLVPIPVRPQPTPTPSAMQNYRAQEHYWQVEENAARRLAEASLYVEQQQRALANEARSRGDNGIESARQADELARQMHEQHDSVAKYANQAHQNASAAQNAELPLVPIPVRPQSTPPPIAIESYRAQEQYWHVEEGAARRLAEASLYVEQQQRALADEARSRGDDATARQADQLAREMREQHDSVVTYANQAHEEAWFARTLLPAPPERTPRR